MPIKLDPVVSEWMRFCFHTRGCDGHKCDTCRHIDMRLLDDLPYAAQDPTRRFSEVDESLVGLLKHAQRAYEHVEGAAVPASVRRSIHNLIELADKTRQMLRLPITPVDKTAREPDQPQASGGTKRRRIARMKIISEDGPQ